MTRKKKILIGTGVVLLLGAIGYANFAFRRTEAVSVTVEKVARHDLEAIVSASGKIRAKRTVNISAETMGKVVNLAVAEGERVRQGQLLLEIDPRNLETMVQNREASLATARSQLEQTRAQIANARVALKQAQDNLRRQQDMWRAGLIPRDTYERAQNDVDMRETDLRVAEQSVKTQEERIRVEEANLASARYDLNKVRMVSPIDGLVTARNVEEGETAVVGTMNNAGTVLLTIADMSVIETEIEVDETDVPHVEVGQRAKIEIDAFPDRVFSGRVTEVGNSPIVAAGAGANANSGRATNFKVIVQLEDEIPDVRPGFTCTATITTATRAQALGVPIQAMTVRELVVDVEGNVVPPDPAPGNRPGTRASQAPAELKDGQSRKEFEGVFVLRNGRAAFVPVKTGIAGEKYFEVLAGVQEGDQVITGPFSSVRTLKEGDAVTVSTSPVAAPTSPAD
jgi:HlyD family secretion protein